MQNRGRRYWSSSASRLIARLDVSFVKEDRRPAFVLDSVEGIELEHCKAERADGVPGLVMMKAKGIKIHATAGSVDFQGDSPGKKEM